MKWLSLLKNSGTKVYCHVTADSERELTDMARRLHEPIKQDIRGQHIDLPAKKRLLALRYGAVEKEDK